MWWLSIVHIFAAQSFVSSLQSSNLDTPCPAGCACDVNQGMVNCSRLNRQDIPTDLPPYTQDLDLSYNQISIVPPYIFSKLSALKSVDLSQNKIMDASFMTNSFASVTSLTSLDLSYNILSRVPKFIPNNITYLYLIQEGLMTELAEDSFTGFQYLYHVDFSFSGIAHVHPKAFTPIAHSLVELFIDFTKLTLEGLPTEVFVHLQKLQSLGLRFNPLTDIPLALPKSLHSLDMVGVNMTVIHRGRLNYLTNLDNFASWQSPITHIEDNSFLGLSQLTLMDMNEMQLSKITKYSFAGLTNLKTIYLYGNNISSIEPGAFAWFEHPQQYWLGGNRLTSLPQSQEPYFSKSSLNFVDLTFNPWYCDCHLRWLKELQEKMQVIQAPHLMVCSGPQALRGKAWDQISAHNFTCPHQDTE